MSEHKDPGISIDLISLIKANIGMGDADAKPTINLQLTHFERRESEDKKNLDVIAGFDLTHGIEKPAITFTCAFIVRYSRQTADSMPWEKFSSPMALAHIVPYLREFTSNMTNRLPVPLLLLPALNTSKMLESFEQRRTAQAAKTN